MIPLALPIYERGYAGVPTTTPITDLRSRARSYDHTISDRFGFESMQVSLHVSAAEAVDWLQHGLMRSVVVSGPDAQIVWEGYLETVAVQMGQKKASLSLSTMANRVRTKYTLYQSNAPNTTSTLQNAASQALYGIKDRVLSLSAVLDLAATAANLRASTALAFPRSVESSDATTGSGGDITLTLSFAGWYGTFDWVFVPSAFDGSTVAQIETLIAALLSGASSINPFVATTSSGIVAMGYALNNFVPSETTFRQQFDKLLSFGDVSGNQLAWGVYENRAFQSAVWAGATPTAITYREDAASGQVYDARGAVVPPWMVRPNAMSQITQLLDLGPATGAVDIGSTKYVARVTCSIQGDQIGCTLEPAGGGGLDRALAALVNTVGNVG